MIFSKCKIKKCHKKSIFFTDYCFEHINDNDKDKIIKEINEFVVKNNTIKGYNFSFVPLDNIDLSKKDISYSIFSRCSMKNVNFTNTTMIATFFDFADLENSDFT